MISAKIQGIKHLQSERKAITQRLQTDQDKNTHHMHACGNCMFEKFFITF